jgi:uncharacterized protein (UPF0333 family)
MEKSIQKKPELNKKLLISISVSGIIVALVVVVIILLVERYTSKLSIKSKRPTVVTSQNAEEVKTLMDEPVPDGSYRVRMNTDWTFDGNISNAYVENAKTNTRTVYFDVFLADSKELVYSSPYMPVGEKIQGFSLDADIEPGSYNGIVTYHLVDEDENEVSNLSVSVTFKVK